MRITAARASGAPLEFTVGGSWHPAGGRLVAELSGTVSEAGAARPLPATGDAAVRLVRVTAVSVTVHVEVDLRFGTGRVDAAREVELGIPLSGLADPRRFVHDVVGQLAGSLAAHGRVGLAGRLNGTGIAEEDVEVSFNLARLLSGTAVNLALRAVR